MSVTTADQARLIVTEATVLAGAVDAALRNLDEALGGWPTRTPMAGPAEPANTLDYTGRCTELAIAHGRTLFDDDGNQSYSACPIHVDAVGSKADGACDHLRPCPTHDTVVALTGPEAHSTRSDNARADLARMTIAIRRAQEYTRAATDIAHRWANPAIDGTSVADLLGEADEKIWCANCARHGHMNVRTHGQHCEFCAGFKSKHKQPPPKEILDIKATRRLNVQDVQRVLDKQKANGKILKAKQRKLAEIAERESRRLAG